VVYFLQTGSSQLDHLIHKCHSPPLLCNTRLA
jgi:hypothetical protein